MTFVGFIFICTIKLVYKEIRYIKILFLGGGVIFSNSSGLEIESNSRCKHWSSL